MKLVITGASGFVGRQLVPILIREGIELLLVGRDPGELARNFPGLRVCGYGDLASAATGFDVLLHLAVLNNDVQASDREFMAVNVDLLLDVLAKSRRAGIRRFINVSSTHALEAGRTDAYSISKRIAADRLRRQAGVTTLYMPMLYGDRWTGRLGFLNRLPPRLARGLFCGFAALKPVAHIRHLAAVVHEGETGEREIVLSDGQDRNPVFKLAKRTIDLAFALVVILLFWWALLLIWMIVRLQTDGPGIFAQRRVGRDCAEFICMKFRTMSVGTAEVGTHDVSPDAITPIGRFLRSSKLDELPQVVNVLRNEVSLVGPRPCLPVQTELIEARRRYGVLAVAPGITGLAQVHGVDMSNPEVLARLDSQYIAMQSLLLDLRIMLWTLRRPRGAPPRAVPGRVGKAPAPSLSESSRAG